MAYLTETELRKMGFARVGRKVMVSDKASIYGAENIEIGDNVRIDDFCILSSGGGSIRIGNHIHIANHCSIFGSGGVVMEDFSGLSSYVSLYSASDSYDGNALIGPTMDEDTRDVIKKPIRFEKYCTCGSHAVVLPGVTLHEGSILGALSLAIKGLDAWSVYSGVPAKKIRERQRGLIEKARLMEQRWRSEQGK